MRNKRLRQATGILTLFIALSAVGGGSAILAGAEDFPLEWLEGTPFRDFTIPALILIFVVGGSAAFATILTWTHHRLARISTMGAGVVMMGEIGTDLAILNQEPPGPHWIQIFYFGLGLIVFLLGYSGRRNFHAG